MGPIAFDFPLLVDGGVCRVFVGAGGWDDEGGVTEVGFEDEGATDNELLFAGGLVTGGGTDVVGSTVGGTEGGIDVEQAVPKRVVVSVIKTSTGTVTGIVMTEVLPGMVIVDTVGTQTGILTTTEPVGCGVHEIVVTVKVSGKVVNDVVEVVLRLVVVSVTVLVSVGVGVHTVVIFSTFTNRLISSTEDRNSNPNESPVFLPQ
jgi:hypothetical protein